MATSWLSAHTKCASPHDVQPEKPWEGGEPGRDGVRRAAVLLGRLLAHERAADRRRAAIRSGSGGTVRRAGSTNGSRVTGSRRSSASAASARPNRCDGATPLPV